MKTTISSIIAASAFSLFISAAQADVETYQTHGVVQSIDASAKTITVKQDAVTELGWPARTMSYSVDGNNILDGIMTGEAVDVTFTADSPYHADVHFIHPTKM